jgi:hypothetical protein
MASYSNSRRARYVLLYAFYLFVLVEVAARSYLTIAENANFLHPETVLYKYYPELGNLKQERVDGDDGYFDILFLGGSVLNPEFGEIEQLLLDKLTDTTGRDIRIHNLSAGGHTSLDSYYKYLKLGDKQFDFVFVYHGINEVRANNSPDDVFRNDYSHYVWYRSINLIENHQELKYLAFPYVFAQALMQYRDRLDPPDLLPTYIPKSKWTRYGGSIKTVPALSANLRKIIDIAIERDEPLLLATFAFHVPADYSLEKFEAKSLDYGRHMSPLEVWGEPQNVITGLLTHNKVIRDTAWDSPPETQVMLVDMNSLIPKDGEHFNDVCHLTYVGAEKFADNLLPFVGRSLEQANPE